MLSTLQQPMALSATCQAKPCVDCSTAAGDAVACGPAQQRCSSRGGSSSRRTADFTFHLADVYCNSNDPAAPFYDPAAHAAGGGGDGPNMGAHDARASEGEHARRRKPMREAAAPEAASSALYGGVSGVAGGDGHALPTAFNVRSSFDGSRRLHGDSFGGAPDFDMGMGAKTLSSLSLSELDQMHDFE